MAKGSLDFERFTRREWLAGLSGAALARSAAPERPNFILILLDDMGWRDLGCYGSKFYESPNIDRLAAQGMRFTDAYAAAPVCSPTRASVMTGKYPARLGMTHIIQYGSSNKAEWIQPPSARQLPPEEVTIAETLKSAGHVTASIGKWHLGRDGASPEGQGFDLNIGGTQIAEPPSFFYPAWKGKPPAPGQLSRGVPLEGHDGEYLTDRLNNEALKFIEDNRSRPFFLYLSHYAVHVPIEAKEEVIARFRRKKLVDSQDNAVYAAMINAVDEGVGRIMAQLKKLGIDQRTVILLSSDNGGLNAVDGSNTPATSNLPLRMGKLSVYEGGIREPLIVKWPKVTKPGSICKVPVISNDFYPTMVEIAGIRDDPGHPVDGLSLAPLLRGGRSLDRDALYWHYPHRGYNNAKPSGAIREGNFKLIEFFQEDRVELYNLAEDIGEQKDLASQMPEKASAMLAKLHAWQKSIGARKPVRNPDYKPSA